MMHQHQLHPQNTCRCEYGSALKATLSVTIADGVPGQVCPNSLKPLMNIIAIKTTTVRPRTEEKLIIIINYIIMIVIIIISYILQVSSCPTCRQPLQGRNILAEKLARSFYGDQL